MLFMAKEKYDEATVLKELSRAGVKISGKVIDVGNRAGLKTLGKVDFLTNYCGYFLKAK
jgi:hypothetical protein